MSRKGNPKLPESMTLAEGRDLHGQMSRKAWSCLVLDFADKAAPVFGKEGVELYYRLAQDVEAWSTTFEGAGEAQGRAILANEYLIPSHNEFIRVNELFGLSTQPPAIPGFGPWVISNWNIKPGESIVLPPPPAPPVEQYTQMTVVVTLVQSQYPYGPKKLGTVGIFWAKHPEGWKWYMDFASLPKQLQKSWIDAMDRGELPPGWQVGRPG